MRTLCKVRRVNQSEKPDGQMGWMTLAAPEGGLHVRFRERDGRLVVTDLYLHADKITSDLLRSISISQLEARVNTPSSMDIAAQIVAETARLEQPSPPPPDPTMESLRRRYEGLRRDLPPPPERTPLRRPTGMSPDEFYPLVAEAYAEYAQRTRAPAKEIAAEADVPVTTAHRWIREARRRGFLPPARRGRAG